MKLSEALENSGISAIIYGEAGSGKTHFCGTLPGKTLIIAAACYEDLFEKTLSNIKEVKARGAEVLGIALEGNRAMSAESDDVLYVPRTEPMFNAIAEIIPMQLLSYYVAKENGCDIDKPKNLAKSVTVE